MVIAGVVIDKKDEKKLKALGVRDSKTLSPKKREELSMKIEEIARPAILMRVPACKIYSYRKEHNINLDKLEAIKIAQIVDLSNANRVYIDSLGNSQPGAEKPGKFENLIRENLTGKNIDLVVENYADETYPIVSAASIMAKVERDRAIDELKRKVGFDFGVGYSHDARAVKFLEKILQESQSPPSFIRWHWSTVEETAERLLKEGKRLQPWVLDKVMNQDSWQRRIKDFFIKKENCREGESEN
jgi:ribonuclease HII